MNTHIQITGLQYTCEGKDMAALMEELDQQHPEVLLVQEQTNDFGTVVHALIGSRFCGVVSRFDLGQTLGMMQYANAQVLVGQVAKTHHEGRCYDVSICGDFPILTPASHCAMHLWDKWEWTGAPLMDSSPEERHLDISLKVALAELQLARRMNKQTLLEHLHIVLRLTQWDICNETQQQLDSIRRLLEQHEDCDVRRFAPLLRHSLTALGSQQRATAFRDTYFPLLCKSAEAEQMNKQWHHASVAHLSDSSQWKPTIQKQLQDIEDSLKRLPADLYYQIGRFDALMHRLLYLDIPRHKLTMLLSALVLRQLLKQQIGLAQDNTESGLEEHEQLLIRQLAPAFFGNTTKAMQFLLLVRGKKASDITSIVSRGVNERVISSALCHRPLWTILHNAGIYTATESNWNSRLNIRKRLV